MAETKKISESELARINNIKKEAVEIASALGELHYQNTLLEMQIDSQKQRVVELRKEEAKLFEELKDSYGNINIDLNTGEYTEVQ
jgi:hypothetical protein